MQSQGSPAGPSPKGQVNLPTLHSRAVIWSVSLSKKPFGSSVRTFRGPAGKVSEVFVVQPKTQTASTTNDKQIFTAFVGLLITRIQIAPSVTDVARPEDSNPQPPDP